jgi:hypothetical protein
MKLNPLQKKVIFSIALNIVVDFVDLLLLFLELMIGYLIVCFVFGIGG